MATSTSTATPNGLLRGENAAIETYGQALSTFEDAMIQAELQRIRSEHSDSATRLRQFVRLEDEEPTEGSGSWGYFAAAYVGGAKMLGDQSTLAALRTGEEHGVSDYESALEDDSVDAQIKLAIRPELLPRCQRHVETLNRLINQLEQG